MIEMSSDPGEVVAGVIMFKRRGPRENDDKHAAAVKNRVKIMSSIGPFGCAGAAGAESLSSRECGRCGGSAIGGSQLSGHARIADGSAHDQDPSGKILVMG
jgi:hypothetical protein